MMKIAVYPGSFDPITNGHIDLVERALEIFDEIYLTISINAAKKPLFSLEERVAMISEVLSENSRVKIATNDGLIVNFVRKVGAVAIVRGLRALSDFEYEFQMALMNRKMAIDVETVFLMPREEYIYLNSSLVKELACFNAPLQDLVPPLVAGLLKEKLKV